MRVGATVDFARTTNPHLRRTSRARLALLSILAMLAGLLAAAGGAAPASAVQAPGHDAVSWAPNWSWTYATTFNYNDGAGINVNLNETVTYKNLGIVSFAGQDAYKMQITGTINSGGGSAQLDGTNVTLKNFSGTVAGTRHVRVSDLALLQEEQQQHIDGEAQVSIITVDITADIDLTLTPQPGWRTHDFPLNPGDSWQNNTSIDYNGGFTYDAGSLGGTGSSPFVGTLPFVGPSNVISETVNVPIGNVASDKITAVGNDGVSKDTLWWSPAHKNDAKEILVLPLDGGALTLTRNLQSASTPLPATTVSATVTPSLTCAGGNVTVTGQLSSFATGAPVTVRLDQSQISPGSGITATTATGPSGNYTATLPVPAQADGLSKNGSRANWGVVVSAGGATGVATVVVTPQNCTTLTYTGATSAPHTGTANVSAQLTDLTGGPVNGRTITFTLSGGGGSTSGVTNAAGVATASLPVNGAPRSATITTGFAAGGGLEAANDSDTFTVTTIPTTTTVSPSASPATIGDPLTFTATVAPNLGSGTPAGSVQFNVDGFDFGAAVPLDGTGHATSAILDTLDLGNHTVTATYLGNASYTTSSGVATFLVRNPLLATATTINAVPSTSVFGQTVTLSAKVTGSGGTPGGSVVWSEGGTPLASATLDAAGEASAPVSDLPVGGHSIVATYSGDATYAGSVSAAKNVSVAKADVDVVLTSSDTTTLSGEGVNFSVGVTAVAPGAGTPNGTVQLVIDGSDVGAPVALVGGTATFPTVTSLITGNHTIAASYSGSSNFENGSDSLSQQVAQADTVTSVIATPSPSNEGQNIAITANVAAVAPGSGAPTGTVVITANGDTVGAGALVSGTGGSQVTINASELPPGSYSLVATYVGDTGYGGSVSEPVSHTVIAGAAIVATTTGVTSSQNPSTYGELISFTAQVEAADGSDPVGGVQFSLDGADFGGPVPVNAQGVAESVTLGSPDPGDHTVIATFVPAAGYSGSGDILTQTVAAAGVDLDVVSSVPSSTYGQGVSFTATVTSQQLGTADPTGHVQFVVDGLPLGDAVEIAGGQATSATVSDLLPGAHTVAVVYSGDVHFVSENDSITQDVAKIATTTTLATSATSTTFGEAVTFTATVDPALDTLGSPSGTVIFMDGSTTLATLPASATAGSNATASLTVSDLGAGAHAIKAVYSGAPSWSGSSSAITPVTVDRLPTSISAQAAVVKLLPLGLPLGQLRVTLNSPNGPVGGQPIVFKVGSQTVCTSTTDSSGVATCSASHLLVQLVLFNGYKATYAGDADHLPSSGQAGILK